MLKGTADDDTEMATDSLEFVSFQLQQPSTNTKPYSLLATFNDQANYSNNENGQLNFNQLKNAVSQEVNCQSMQDTDILNILPSGTEQRTYKMDTSVLSSDFSNILDSEAVHSTPTVTTTSSSRNSGLTMEFTDVIEGTLENASNGFSVFNDATTVDETLVNASKNGPLLPEILPSSSNVELSAGEFQKKNAVPAQFATANQQSDETSEFTMDITTSKPEIVNSLIQQLVAAQEVNKQSMNPSIDVSVADTASALSIFQDPAVMPSLDKAGEEVNHSNEKSKLDFSLSDSMVNLQKENQIPFHRFQEKTKEPAESETQAESTTGFSQDLSQEQQPTFAKRLSITPATSNTTSNNQRTTLLSSTAKPITTTTITKVPTVEGLVKKQIELDFNQSRNASMNTSCDNSRNMSQSDSVFLNSPNLSTLLVKNCVRKCIGFGLKDRLIQKTQELNLQREKEAKQQQNSTVNNTTETHPMEQSTRESTEPIEAPVPEVAAPAPVAADNQTENVTKNESAVMDGTTSMDFTDQSMTLDDDDIKRILDDTCEITKYELMNDLSLLSTESLEDFQSTTLNDRLYRGISTLDFTSLHIRIHEMNPNTCVVRFFWGTLEVRINFGEIIKEEQNGSQVREMTFHTISMLPSNKEIPYEVMRGLKERARYDGDDMFLRYREEHRPLLQLAHSYITNRFHEECRDLIKKYPDSSKLLDLLHNLSNIVDTARKNCVELRHMYSRERMQLLAPDSEGRFRFSVKLLGVRLCSQFEVQFTFDPMKYPYEVIHPEIVVPELDQQLYPLGQFKAALLMVKPCNFNYLTSLIQGARFFVCALRKVLLANLKQQKQKAEIRAVKLLD